MTKIRQIGMNMNLEMDPMLHSQILVRTISRLMHIYGALLQHTIDMDVFAYVQHALTDMTRYE